MKTAGLITVRTASTRLPQKALQTIGIRRVIEHVIDRAKVIRGLDDIVVCTTQRAEDDVLEDISRAEDVLCFRGSSDDKLLRWRDAADRVVADRVVTLDGDDPFFGPELIEMELDQMQEHNPDFLNIPKGLVCGGAEFCISSPALRRVCEIKDTSDTEMMWVYFTDTGLFDVRDFNVGDSIYWNDRVRLTLDYPEDLEFFRAVFREMGLRANTTPLRDILAFLDSRPDLIEINAFRHAEWLANQKAKTRLVLKDR